MLAFLSGLVGTGATQTVPVFQALIVHPSIVIAPIMDKALKIDSFSHLVVGSVMNGMEHVFLQNFIKIKPPTFECTESENVF